MECTICKEEIEKQTDDKGKVYWDQGHNAEPVAEGRCCDKCNIEKVIPSRLGLIFASRMI